MDNRLGNWTAWLRVKVSLDDYVASELEKLWMDFRNLARSHRFGFPAWILSLLMSSERLPPALLMELLWKFWFLRGGNMGASKPRWLHPPRGALISCFKADIWDLQSSCWTTAKTPSWEREMPARALFLFPVVDLLSRCHASCGLCGSCESECLLGSE